MLLAKEKKIKKKKGGGRNGMEKGYFYWGGGELTGLKGLSEIHTEGMKWDSTPGSKVGKDLGNTSCVNCIK